jgi:hypothetical protein
MEFSGLDLATCQSGTFRGRTKLSKYGNVQLRPTFWMAAKFLRASATTAFATISDDTPPGRGRRWSPPQGYNGAHRQDGAWLTPL